MDALGPWHLLIIAAFFVMLFGAKRLPEAARSLGRSARIMKSELKGMQEESKTADQPATEPGPVTLKAHLDQSPPPVAAELPVAALDDGPR